MKTSMRNASTWFLAPVLALCLSVPLAAADAVAAPAPSLNYQGRLLENGSPVTGNRFFKFSILSSTNVQQWQSGELSIAVTDGLYAVLLNGFSTTILANAGLKLRVEAGQASGVLVALAPDIALMPSLQATTAFAVTPGAVGTDGLVDGAVTAGKLAPGVIISGPTGPQGPTGLTGPQGPAGTGGTGGDTTALQSAVDALAARIATLEAPITSATLPGTYNLMIFQSEVTGNPDAIISTYTSTGTMVLSAGGGGSAVFSNETGSALVPKHDILQMAYIPAYSVPDGTAELPHITYYPSEFFSAVAPVGIDINGGYTPNPKADIFAGINTRFVRRDWTGTGQSYPSFSWTYGAGQLTTTVGVFNVSAHGDTISRSSSNLADGTSVIIIGTRAP